MEAAAQWLVIIVIVLAAIGYAIRGLVWLFENELAYCILGVAAVCALVIAYFRPSQSSKISVDTGAIATQARQAEQILRESRRTLEREAEALRSLRLAVRDEVNFEAYRQAHRESRIAADRWYKHKRGAIETRNRVSSGLNQIREKKRQLDARRNRSSQIQRRKITLEIQATQSVISELQGVLSSLNEEVNRGARSLDAHNQQTGRLRDHIRDNCGPKGRRWFNELEARKRKIIGN